MVDVEDNVVIGRFVEALSHRNTLVWIVVGEND